jgi:long-chain acyl-CoA synthetase
MKWRIFSRKKRDRRPVWRLLEKSDADVADVGAYPAAVAEGCIASKYLLSSRKHQATLLLLGVRRRGVLVGPDVNVVEDEAERRGVDVARTPRAGRAGARPAQTVSFEEMVLAAADDCPQEPLDPDALACLIYTSGTEGKPKGTMLSHKNFIQDCELIDALCSIRKGDRVAGVLPMFHIFGLTNVLIGAFVQRAAIILIPQYSPLSLLRALCECRANFLLATPTIFKHILRLQQRHKIDLPGVLRVCVSGAAPLEKHIIDEFEQVFGTALCEGYGLTESTSAVCLNPPDGKRKAGSIGVVPPGIEMKVVDEDGVELPPGAVGEVVIRGDTVMLGYYNRPEETAKTIRDGWLYTGDLGMLDEEGYFFITDRKKEIIIKGGYNISPREVEEVILAHPAVRETAVIGIRKEEREAVKAFVVARGGLSAEEILSHCRGELSSYKVPDIVEFRDVLPKSLTGKVLKKELSDSYSDDRLIERESDAARRSP